MAPKKKLPVLRRMRLAFVPSLLLAFMYAVWGPMEVYVSNAANFRFTYFEAVWPLALTAAAATAVLTLLLSLLPRRLFRIALALLFAFTACSYLQNQFFNLDLGLLEGEDVLWEEYTRHGWINLALWGVLLAAITVGLQFFKRPARVVLWLSSFLLIVQGTTFAAVSVKHLTGDADRSREPTYLLSGAQQYDVSTEGNVVIFILDYFSNDYIDAMLKRFPDALAPFRDFTYYNNCDPGYIGTFPSVVHMFTGAEFDNTVPIEDWFKQAWSGAPATHFYQSLREKGYKFNFFDSSNNYFGLQHAGGVVNNLVVLEPGSYTMRYGRLLDRMLTLSLYRHLPHTFKEYFYQVSADFYGIVGMGDEEIRPCYNRNAYHNVLSAHGLHPIENDGKYLIVEFLRGTHPPYVTDENAAWNPGATLEECAAGYMKMVGTYLDKLREQGLYDDTTVIVTSDHGDKENSMQVLYFIKEAGAHREEMAVSTAPISHSELLGTILHNIGAPSPYAQSIYDFSDGEVRPRTVMRNYIDRDYPPVPRYHSTAQGTHTVLYAYTYEGDRRDLRKQVRRGPTEIQPLTESFN